MLCGALTGRDANELCEKKVPFACLAMFGIHLTQRTEKVYSSRIVAGWPARAHSPAERLHAEENDKNRE